LNPRAWYRRFIGWAVDAGSCGAAADGGHSIATVDARGFVRHLEAAETNAATLRAVHDLVDLIRAHPDSARAIAARLTPRERELIGVR
jgi:hypothetical protein